MNRLTSPRLLLTPLKAEDKDLFTGLYRDPQVMSFIATELSETEAERRFTHTLTANNKLLPRTYCWCIKTRRQLPIGILGLSRYGRAGEIGILLRPQAQRQGYAKELLHLMQQRLSSEATLDELLLRTHKKNEPMKKVALAVGFKPVMAEPEHSRLMSFLWQTANTTLKNNKH
ncbi:GNAT family N-acetyltransferase [Shewanella algae]|uniref:GNAT family N-acetyltransferase n=1 Tax=Shewanella algae TaxID=38313 RepID=UPI0031F5C511